MEYYYYGDNNANTINATATNGVNYTYAYGGNDTVNGSAVTDYVYGGTGTDLIYGNDGNDYLYGEDGNDTLRGGNGDDYLYGGAGDDNLYGSVGNDNYFGGPGNDHYYHAADTGVDFIADKAGGTDTIHLTGMAQADMFMLRDGNDLFILDVNDSTDGVRIENFYTGGIYLVENLITSEGCTFYLPHYAP